jgi:hypothetical protein
MDLCVCESEECEDGVGAGVNGIIIMSDVLYGIRLVESVSSTFPCLPITSNSMYTKLSRYLW